MPNPRFIALVQAQNLRAEIWINDIPAIMLLPGQADGTDVPLNEFVVSGGNKVRVVLHAGPLASASTEPWPDRPAASGYRGPAALALSLAQYADDQPTHREGPPAIARIEWQGTAAPVPLSIEREFQVAAVLGPWGWQDAQRFPALNDAVRAAALEYLGRMHGLLAAGQFDAFMDESALKIEEYARAYGIAAEPTRSDMLGALRSQTPRLHLRPFDPRLIDLRLVAGGRMIECLRTDRRHALEFAGPGDGPGFFLPTMLGLTAKGWLMLR